MHRAHVNIGSNVGDRRGMIERGVEGVWALSEGVRRRSRVVESEPWGFDSENCFLNVGVEIDTTLEPEELLEKLLEVERGIWGEPHRNADGSYRDRGVDIDLICVDMEVRSTERLTLPHPRMWEREFVMEPLRELSPDWVRMMELKFKNL